MRITALTLKNFQAVDSVQLADFGAMNILIGPKHAGKTSILESMYFQFHHASLADEQAYFQFLNQSNGRAEGYYSIESVIQEQRATQTIQTTVRDGKAGDMVQQGSDQITGSKAERILATYGGRIKYISTWDHSKDVYYGGPETPVEQRKRMQQALQELSRNGKAWARFLKTLRDFFPQLVFGKDPVQDIIDFFGVGFMRTVKMLLYLHDPRIDILLIDEPEMYFYPNLARRFVHLLSMLLGEGVQKQVFIATHSPMFLNQQEIKHFYHIQRDHTGHIRAARRDRDELLRSLEYSGAQPESILTSEMILYVEGPWDISVFEEFIRKFPELSRVHLSIQQLGGGAVGNLNMDPLRLKQNNLFSFVILDSEKRDKNDRGDSSHFTFRDKCYRAHMYCMVLTRRAIENYFTPRALRSIFKNRISKNFINRPYDILDHQLRWYDKEMNRSVARAMTKDEILSYPDLHDFFSTLIQTAKKFG